VEPKYEKKLGTLEEILDSDVVYGYHPALNYIQDTISFPEFVNFLENKDVKEDCSDIRTCVERMITKGDIASVIPPFYANYIARELGAVNVGKVICSFDKLAVSGALIIIFKKGNPLLESFNILMRRYLEAGFLEILLTELDHRASLRGGGRFAEAAGDVFFAFSFSHIAPAFVVLLVGTVLSSVVFIVEVIVNCLCKRMRKYFRAIGERNCCISLIAQIRNRY
jgi:hypothetical protein